MKSCPSKGMKGAMLSFICTLTSSCPSYEMKWSHVSPKNEVLFLIWMKSCPSYEWRRQYFHAGAIPAFIWALMRSCPSYRIKSYFSYEWSHVSHRNEVLSVIWMKGAMLSFICTLMSSCPAYESRHFMSSPKCCIHMRDMTSFVWGTWRRWYEWRQSLDSYQLWCAYMSQNIPWAHPTAAFIWGARHRSDEWSPCLHSYDFWWAHMNQRHFMSQDTSSISWVHHMGWLRSVSSLKFLKIP